MIVSLNHERVTIVFFYRRKHVSGEKVAIIAATLSTEPVACRTGGLAEQKAKRERNTIHEYGARLRVSRPRVWRPHVSRLALCAADPPVLQATEPAWQNLDLHCQMWKTYIQKVTSGETTFCNGFLKKVILFYKSSFYNIEKLQLWLIFFIIDFYWLKSCQSQGATEIPRSLRPF